MIEAKQFSHGGAREGAGRPRKLELPEPDLNSEAVEPVTEAVEPPSLDERIADLLTTPDSHTALEFDAAITEAKQAIEATEAELREAKARSSDPAILDPTAPDRAHHAEHRLTRLRNAIEALGAKGREALRRERTAQWEDEIHIRECVVVGVARELLENYPRLAGELLDLMKLVADANARVRETNYKAAREGLRRLESVGQVLGIDDQIFERLTLPSLTRSGHAPHNLWPPKPRDHVLEFIQMTTAMIQSAPVVETGEAMRAYEQQRIAQFYADQEAGREKLNAQAAARAAAAAAERRKLANGG
jgi:hypothetical protein